MSESLQRRPRAIHNVFCVAAALLIYIVPLFFFYRQEIPVYIVSTTKQSSSSDEPPNPNGLGCMVNETENSTNTKDTKPLPGNISITYADSDIVFQPSPGIVWLMSFGGSVRAFVLACLLACIIWSGPRGRLGHDKIVIFNETHSIVFSFFRGLTGNFLHHYQCRSFHGDYDGNQLWGRF